ncbi:MAG: hypothetical protein ABI901_01445, partial [Roseiflexaceae bacterium]
SGLDKLAPCVGDWQGMNRLHDPNTNAPDDSPSTATVVLMLDGKFIRIDYILRTDYFSHRGHRDHRER